MSVYVCPPFLEDAQIHHSGEKTGLGESEADADANELRIPAARLALETHFRRGMTAYVLTRPISVTMVPQRTVMNGRKRDGRKRFKTKLCVLIRIDEGNRHNIMLTWQGIQTDCMTAMHL